MGIEYSHKDLTVLNADLDWTLRRLLEERCSPRLEITLQTGIQN